MLNKRDQQWFSEMIRNEALKGNSDGPSDDGGRRDDNDGC